MATNNIAAILMLIALALTSLAGCGKKGELELPQPHPIKKEKPHTDGN